MKGYSCQIKVCWAEVKTYREVIIPEAITFKQMHQILMGLSNKYPYQFQIMNKKIVINNSSLDNETVMGCEYRNINRCYVDEYFKVGEKIFYQYDPRAKRDCMVEIKDIIELYPTLKGYEFKYNLLEDYEASYGWNFIVSRKENLEYEDCDEFDYLIPNLSEYNKENTQKP